MRRFAVLFFVLAFALVLEGCNSAEIPVSLSPPFDKTPDSASATGIPTSSFAIEGEGFSTSREAAEAYLDAFFNVDFDKLISACAVETYVKNFDSLALLQRTRHLNFLSIPPGMLYSAMVGFDEKLATQSRVAEILQQINFSYRWFCLSGALGRDYDELLKMRPIILGKSDPYAEAREFYNNLERDYNAEKLRAVINYRLLTPLQYGGEAYEMYGSESTARSLDSVVLLDGADDCEEFVALFDSDGEEWAVPLRTLCYSGKWYAEPGSIFAVILGFNAYTTVERVSELSYHPESAAAARSTDVRRGSVSATQGAIEGTGANSAKDAVSAYMDGFLGADFEKTLLACAVETYVRNYSSVERAGQTNMISINEGMEQDVYSFDPQLAAASRTGAIATMIRVRYVVLCSEGVRGYFDSSDNISFSNEEEIVFFYNDFVRDFDSRKLHEVTGYKILTVEDFSREVRDNYASEGMKKAIQNLVEYSGADDYESFIATFVMPDGNEWVLGIGAFKYGSKWYADHNSSLAMALKMNYYGISLLKDLD